MMKRSLTRRTQQTEEKPSSTLLISTGSTLLDLAISGGRWRGGGIPGGILVEIFGPSGCGKTVLLCELAGSVQRKGGKVMFMDPEARLNTEYAKMFGLNPDDLIYERPNTISQLFKPLKEWKPEPEESVIHGIFADSLAALSTEMEMEDKDQYGMRRAKEFSEELRKTCRILAERGFLMVCSNQIRQNIEAGPYGQKWVSPGGEAIGFYSSLRLRCSSPKRLKKKATVKGKEVETVVGVETEIEVWKSSVWKPFKTATVTILFDYGIDDIRQNLKFLRRYTGSTTFKIGDLNLGKSLEEAIQRVEDEGLEQKLKDEVIDLWEEMEGKLRLERRPKKR